jgi:hypothetical protein
MVKKLVSSILVAAVSAGFASAATNVEVTTPNIRVQVGTPKPPPPPITVIERETVIVKEKDHHDNGKHKGHYKKDKKHKKHKKNDH